MDQEKPGLIVKRFRKKGILAKETHETTIRFAPPLIIDRETIDWALPRIKEVLVK